MARVLSAFEQRAAADRRRAAEMAAAARFAPTDFDRAFAARDQDVLLPTRDEILAGLGGALAPEFSPETFQANVARDGDVMRREALETRRNDTNRLRNGIFDWMEEKGAAPEWAGMAGSVAELVPFVDTASGGEDTWQLANEGKYGAATLMGMATAFDTIPGPVGEWAAIPFAAASRRMARGGARRGATILDADAPVPSLVGHNAGPPLDDDLVPNLGTLPSTPVEIRFEELQELLSGLTPEQRAMITPKQEAAFLRAAQTQAPDELGAMAMAGAPKIGWYQNSAQALHHIFGADTPRFTSLLAATSPQTSVESNLGNALKIWKNWTAAGRPTDPAVIRRIMGQSVAGGKGEGSILPAWINNSVTALSATPEQLVLSGPKVNEFGYATAGDLNRYVLDAWMANASGAPQSMFSKTPSARSPVTGYGPGYLGPTAVGRSVAKQLGQAMGLDVKPSHVQEAVWSWAKAAFEARQAEGIGGRTIREMVEAGEITPEMIDAVPDFSTLLNTSDYATILREAGYGQKLDELAGLTFGGKLTAEQRAAFAGSLDRDALLRGADRLDRLYESRTHVARTGAYRGRFEGAEGITGGGYTRASGPRNRSLRLADGTRIAAVHKPQPAYTEALQWQREGRQPAAPDFHELVNDGKSRLRFHQRMKAAKDSRGASAAGVDVHHPDNYRSQRMFTTPDGSAGFAIGADGELNSVISGRGSPHKGISDAVLNVATANGATWLSAFDIGLPKLYAKAGFKPVARVPFNDEYAPEGWDYKHMGAFNKGRPDVVFMVYDPDFKGQVAERYGGKVMNDYEAAQEYARRSAARERAKDRTRRSPDEDDEDME